MKILKKLKSKGGMSATIEFIIVLLLLMSVIAASIEVAGVMTMKKGIEDMATETARYVELNGAVDNSVYGEFDRLKGVTGVPCELSIEGDMSSSGRLQLEAPFTVTVTAMGKLFQFEIPLVAKATGRSEVYHK